MLCIPVNIADSIISTLGADGRTGSDLVEIGFFEREDLDHEIHSYPTPPNPINWERVGKRPPSHHRLLSVTARREVK